MKLRGDFVDIMFQVNPEYKKHVRYENLNKVLYVLVIRAIYGFIESALLFYNLLSTTLQVIGFEINHYEKLFEKNIIEGKKYNIAWYVDDNKLSHKIQQ